MGTDILSLKRRIFFIDYIRLKTSKVNMKEASFYSVLNESVVQCFLCPHKCTIKSGGYGKCGARKNSGGVLNSMVYGHLIAENIDPVEKKPLYHFLPGSKTFSIASPGCNLFCRFCQNWQISQLREDISERFLLNSASVSPDDIIGKTTDIHAKSISFTYTEPTVFYEFMKDTSQLALKLGLSTIMVSNGYISQTALEELLPYIAAFNIDLKSFSDEFYRKECGAQLAPVLETLRRIAESDSWLEITTLVIPGKNDSFDELYRIASFIAEIGSFIPWHISKFFPNYRMNNIERTSEEILENGACAAQKCGIKFLYFGNSARDNSTLCPNCGTVVVERSGYDIKKMINKNGLCRKCGRIVNGVW